MIIAIDKRFLLALFSSLALSAPAAAALVHEGEWETAIDSKTEVPGMPFAMPTISFKLKQCLTEQDMVPNTSKENQRCEVKNRQVNGSKVTWQAVCTNKNGATTESEGEMTYSGDTFQGFVHGRTVSTKPNAQPVKTESKLSGHYVGACKK